MSIDVHTLSGAYALDALTPEEAAEFRQHLQECRACRDEVAEFQRAAARMGLAEAATPPPALRARVLAAADRTRQTPPSPAPQVLTHRRWVTWVGAAAAAMLIAVGGVVGLRAAVQDDEPALNEAAVEVFEADDARTATVETANGGRLRVGVSESANQMAVDTRELPDLGQDLVYQIWSVSDGQMASAAILEDPEEGAAMELPGEETEVAVTVEPVGGSEQPTSEPIVQVDPYAV